MIKQLLESKRALIDVCLIVDCIAFWNRFDSTHGDWIVIFWFDFVDWVWLRENEEWKSQVDKTVLNVFKSSISLNELVDLSRNGTSNHSSSCGDSWDDLTSNSFSLVSLVGGDLIIYRSQVWTVVNEINVEIGIIILLKLSSLNLIFIDRPNNFWKSLKSLFYKVLIIWRKSSYFSCLVILFLFWKFYLNLLWFILRYLKCSSKFLELCLIDLLWNAEGKCDQVRVCHDK